MRTIWFRGIGIAAAAGLTLAMLAINNLFEAAGSVADLPGCGFLAGNLVALFLLYPVAAGALSVRAVRPLARRFPNEERRIVRCGGQIGLAGALLYFGAGLLLTPESREAPPLTWVLLTAYTVLCALGGRAGALSAVLRERAPAWHDSRS